MTKIYLFDPNCKHPDYDDYFDRCPDCGFTPDDADLCDNCGSPDTHRNGSGDLSCNNCGWCEEESA
jgi:hypothetical protein